MRLCNHIPRKRQFLLILVLAVAGVFVLVIASGVAVSIVRGWPTAVVVRTVDHSASVRVGDHVVFTVDVNCPWHLAPVDSPRFVLPEGLQLLECTGPSLRTGMTRCGAWVWRYRLVVQPWRAGTYPAVPGSLEMMGHPATDNRCEFELPSVVAAVPPVSGDLRLHMKTELDSDPAVVRPPGVPTAVRILGLAVFVGIVGFAAMVMCRGREPATDPVAEILDKARTQLAVLENNRGDPRVSDQENLCCLADVVRDCCQAVTGVPVSALTVKELSVAAVGNAVHRDLLTAVSEFTAKTTEPAFVGKNISAADVRGLFTIARNLVDRMTAEHQAATSGEGTHR